MRHAPFPCFSVAHTFEDEDSRRADDADDALSVSDIDRDDEKRDSFTHLSRHASDRALNMDSKVHRGMLNRTVGTWCFW